MPEKDQVVQLAARLYDRKALDIAALNVSGLTVLCDCSSPPVEAPLRFPPWRIRSRNGLHKTESPFVEAKGEGKDAGSSLITAT